MAHPGSMPTPATNALEKWNAELAFRSVVEATSDRSGIEFLRQLVKSLAQSLGVDYAFVAEFAGAEPALGSVDIALYRDDVGVGGRRAALPVVGDTVLDFDVSERSVVLVDDVLYTGRTIRAAIDAVFDYGRPPLVQLAVLVDRGHRELPIRPDYVGRNLPTSRSERVTVHLAEIDGVDEVVLESDGEGLA